MRPGRCWTSASAASSRPSFADIFFNNCFKNGVLPVALRAGADREPDARGAHEAENPAFTVDLEQQTVAAPERRGAVHLRGRPVPQALPPERPRRHRPDHAAGASTSTASRRQRAAQPWLISGAGVMAAIREHDRPCSARVLLLPGDGIGPEVMREVRRVIDWFARRRGLELRDRRGPGRRHLATTPRHAADRRDHGQGARGRCGAVRRGRRPEIRRAAVRGQARARPAAPAQGDGPVRQPAPGDGVRRRWPTPPR